MNLKIRTAKDDDAAEIARILKQSREVAIPYALIPYSFAEIENWVRGSLLEECQVFVVEAEVGNKTLGAVAALSSGWLEQLYVDPEYFGKGLGAALIEQVKNLSEGSLSLHCFEQNTKARQFYEKHGFKLVEYRDGAANEEGVPDCLYRWSAPKHSD
ncbi:GNAT family N-acetyltransferase [Sneathiella sp. P13V-1]|uniref:GNAT family N-acetyltransferase n=1 Tax=Sneathiella sp. P13V-1 TaxID=2697366 RepID=UPI00187BB1A8|nr:GNAT family N-acetyltransferase [Sneathiella sp. P13V-1]MBE7636498.1 GNAT family N-acetyltransferase [Sneathiella sp. P13V-1]